MIIRESVYSHTVVYGSQAAILQLLAIGYPGSSLGDGGPARTIAVRSRMTMEWQPAALRLAREITDPVSRRRPVVASVPRHVLVPRWWGRDESAGWTVRDGPSAVSGWISAAYSDQRWLPGSAPRTRTTAGEVITRQGSPPRHPPSRAWPSLCTGMQASPAVRTYWT
jgi:hypothetical protein